jgi:hypothetical protein
MPYLDWSLSKIHLSTAWVADLGDVHMTITRLDAARNGWRFSVSDPHTSLLEGTIFGEEPDVIQQVEDMLRITGYIFDPARAALHQLTTHILNIEDGDPIDAVDALMDVGTVHAAWAHALGVTMIPVDDLLDGPDKMVWLHDKYRNGRAPYRVLVVDGEIFYTLSQPLYISGTLIPAISSEHVHDGTISVMVRGVE